MKTLGKKQGKLSSNLIQIITIEIRERKEKERCSTIRTSKKKAKKYMGRAELTTFLISVMYLC